MAKYTSFTYELLDELGDEHRLGCKCCRFASGKDLPVPRKLTASETQRAARHFSTSIFKEWTKLNAVIKRFENTIQKRWMKKNVKQRRDLLLKAWPGMSPTHRPDFENMRQIAKQAPRSRTCRSDAYLWPQINLEDLQSRNLLLYFLKSRGRNLPDLFRIADVKTAHLGDGWDRSLDFAQEFDNYCCDFHYLEDHQHEAEGEKLCMLFQDSHSISRYGTVVVNYTTELLPSQYKYLRQSHEGLLSLEIQQKIYHFLLSCAKLILHDVAPADFFLAPCRPEPAMSEVRSNTYRSLSAHSLDACYQVPQKLNLARLRLLVGTRRAAAEDHLWLLKEDPAYFMDTLREWKEHGVSRDDSSCSCESCWNHCAGIALTYAFEAYVFWDDIHRKLIAMPEIDVQLARASDEHVKLHPEDEDRWAALMDVVWHWIVQPITCLESGIPCSPRLRQRYIYCGAEEKVRWTLKSGALEAERRIDQLWFLISREEQREMHGLSGLIQEFQYMLDNEPEAAQYIDPWLATHFSDIALCSDLMCCVDALAPWLDENKAARLVDFQSVNTQVERLRNLQAKLRVGIHSIAVTDQLDWSPTEKGWFDYPADKSTSKANNTQIRVAEKRLDAVWQSMERGVARAAGFSLEKVLECRLVNPRTVFRTAPWIGAHSELLTPPPTPNEKKRGSEARQELASNIQHGNTVPLAKRELVKTLPKDKKKTKGTPAARDPRWPVVSSPPPEIEKVVLSRRAYKVLAALLPSSTEAQQPRPELAWEEFLFTFNAVGLQPIKLYGSAWMFSPVPKGETHGNDDGVATVGKMGLERSIQFHEPKEVRRGQKIGRGMVRAFRRRLKLAFGWETAEQLFESE